MWIEKEKKNVKKGKIDYALKQIWYHGLLIDTNIILSAYIYVYEKFRVTPSDLYVEAFKTKMYDLVKEKSYLHESYKNLLLIDCHNTEDLWTTLCRTSI